MTDLVTPETERPQERGLRYALFGAHGCTVAMAAVPHLLADRDAEAARFLAAGEPLPMGVQPVVVADTTVYGAASVERLMRFWAPNLPRPWVVLTSDAPIPSPPAARFRIRALGARLAGTVTLPYLPVLRTVADPAEALDHKAVQAAAARLRRHLEGN
ncbi:hypothetical protein ACFYN3_39420 [Streptomyces lavendulae]|uniref:hypothetical protein n=1 Tax=Streptomyces lavendulae TaxID=1914 RepID=UPI0036ADC742